MKERGMCRFWARWAARGSLALLLLASPPAGVLAGASQQAGDFKDFKELRIEDMINQEVSIASLGQDRVSTAPGVVSVVTAEEIRNMGARDLRDVLRTIPGFQLGMRCFGYNEVGVRGIITDNSEKVKFLIDDIPVNEKLEGSGTIVFADMPLENVSRIEIIRGPGSALYGANAFVGVVNIVTKRAAEAKGAQVTVKGGSFGTGEANVLFGYSSPRMEVSGFADFLYTDGFRSPVEADAIQALPYGPFFCDLNRGVSLAGTDRGVTHTNNKRTTASVNFASGDFYFRGYLADARKGGYLNPMWTVAEGTEAHPFQAQGIAGYTFRPHARLSLEARAYAVYYSCDNLWNSFPDGYRTYAPSGDIITYTKGQYDRQGAIQRNAGLETIGTAHLPAGHDVVFGLTYEYQCLDANINQSNVPGTGPEGLVDIGKIMRLSPSRTVVSGYVQDQWAIVKSLTVTGGFRFDRYSDAGTSLTPRLALVWQPHARVTCKGLYAHAFRAPTFVESYLYAYGGFAVGNEDIEPETIHTAEFEVTARLTDALNVRVNYFHNAIDNLIRLVPYNQHLEYLNLQEETVVQGFEAEARAVFTKDIYGFANCSFQTGENRKTHEPVVGMAKWSGNVGFNYGLWGHLNLNACLTLVGSRDRAAGDARAPLDGYAFGTFTARLHDLVKNLEFTFSVYNFLNADVRCPDVAARVPGDFPMEHANILCGLRYAF